MAKIDDAYEMLSGVFPFSLFELLKTSMIVFSDGQLPLVNSNLENTAGVFFVSVYGGMGLSCCR